METAPVDTPRTTYASESPPSVSPASTASPVEKMTLWPSAERSYSKLDRTGVRSAFALTRWVVRGGLLKRT